MINGNYVDGAGDLQLTMEIDYAISPYIDGYIDTENMERSTFAVKLQNSGALNVVTNVNTAEYLDCGVRVDKITLTGSPMGTYVRIEFSVIDEVKYAKTDDGLWFEVIDENGNRLPDGASSVGSVGPADDSGVRYIQTISIQASETLPSEIILRGYNCWDKNRYETHTFEME